MLDPKEYAYKLYQEHRAAILATEEADWREDAPIFDALERAAAEANLTNDDEPRTAAESAFGILDVSMIGVTQVTPEVMPNPSSAKDTTSTPFTPDLPSPGNSETAAFTPPPPTAMATNAAASTVAQAAFQQVKSSPQELARDTVSPIPSATKPPEFEPPRATTNAEPLASIPSLEPPDISMRDLIEAFSAPQESSPKALEFERSEPTKETPAQPPPPPQQTRAEQAAPQVPPAERKAASKEQPAPEKAKLSSIPRDASPLVTPRQAVPQPTREEMAEVKSAGVSKMLDVLGSKPQQPKSQAPSAAPAGPKSTKPLQNQFPSNPGIGLAQKFSSAPAFSFGQVPPPGPTDGHASDEDASYQAEVLAGATEVTVLALMQSLDRITAALLQLNSRLTIVEEVLERSFGS